MANPESHRHYAGKRAGQHAMTQDQINALLVELGRTHAVVVRLKGGDPFIFGRGGEEALALAAAGVGFEVVPGISSAYAVPAYAGIPVTQRGMAAQVTVVTGHEDPTKPQSDVDWAALARAPGTLVLLMGVSSLGRNAERLIEAGMAPDTPAAVISNGTRPDQQTVTGQLSGIAAAAADLPSPAITLVGEVATLHDELAWFEQRPLFGRTIAVTRARAQASSLAARLTALGASVLEAPAILIEPLPFTRPPLGQYDDLVLTSVNGVELLLEADVRELAGVRVAAIGNATVAALRGRGIVADVVPPRATSEDLLEVLGLVAGRRILVATAEGARSVLPDGLRQRGATVEVLHLYRTVPEPVDPEAVGAADLVTFASSSTVDTVLGGLDPDTRSRVRAVSIGPVTSASLRAAGIEPVAEADPHDVDGLVDAVLAVARIQ
jgi:uroporphyrinogen III methyltransferase/synthase